MGWQTEPGDVALNMEELAKIGLIAIFEARAKIMATTIIKAIESLDAGAWEKLEQQHFSQLESRIRAGVYILGDTLLIQRFEELVALRSDAQNERNVVVHANWGVGINGKPSSYDQRRERWLSIADIDEALTKNQMLAAAAHKCLWRVAELVESGKLPQGQNGAGVSFSLENGSVNL